MPYIENDRREKKFNSLVECLISNMEDVGDLDYCITKMCKLFIYKSGRIKFENMAKVAGTILFVILENYRRMTAPYEDKKKEINGDVYDNIDDPRLTGGF